MRALSCVMTMMVTLAGMSLLGPRISDAAEGKGSPNIPSSSMPGPDTSIERVRMTEMQMGKRLWEVEADKADLFEDRGIAILTRVVHPVRIVIYNGEETLISLAEKAVVNLRTKDLQLFGHVRSESSQGTKVFSEVLNWSAGNHQISTDAPVVVEKEGYQIRGKGMVADTILERMTIRGRIASQITLSGKREQP